ncbi:MAG: MBL fold metallo-hydrolase [Neisseriaceae bacterium]
MSLKIHTIPVTAFMQNCCILWDSITRDCVISDLGGKVEEVLAFIQTQGLRLKAVWLTHGHLDHVMGVAQLMHDQPEVEVLGPHQDDLFWLQQLTHTAQLFGFPPAETFTPTRWLKENDILTIGSYSFTVLKISGHSPGHVVFYSKQAQLLIAGDVLFLNSIGRSDLPGGNHEVLVQQIKQKLLTLPEATQVITGHGPFTTIGQEKRHNPFLQ